MPFNKSCFPELKETVMLKTLFLVVTLAAFTTVSAQQKQPVDKKKLLGNWISTEDTNYHITFTTTLQREYYGNELQAVNTYKLHSDTLVKTDKQTGTVYTYSVTGITNKNLTLLYLDRGNLLKFT